MSVGTITVNRVFFFTSISHDIFYRSAQYVPNKKLQQYERCLKELIGLYLNADFPITGINCNNEFKTTFTQLVQIYKLQICTVAAQFHVPKAERNNHVIKERVRCTYYNLHYQDMPKTLLIYMVQEAASKLNFFAERYRISQSYSPHMIIHKRYIGYQTHGMFHIREYTLGHQDVTIKKRNAITGTRLYLFTFVFNLTWKTRTITYQN